MPEDWSGRENGFACFGNVYPTGATPATYGMMGKAVDSYSERYHGRDRCCTGEAYFQCDFAEGYDANGMQLLAWRQVGQLAASCTAETSLNQTVWDTVDDVLEP